MGLSMADEETSVMFDIKGILVSLDVAERYFCCDLDACHGECCIEGDAGAPITVDEQKALERVLPEIIDDLLPAARQEIEKTGVSYIDEEGDLVTSIVEGRNCVFTTMAPGGMCQCAVEKAYREGRIDFRKPISCYLYPIRVDRYPTCTALNYHRWKICRAAETNGRRLGLRLYEFLREPLTEAFGREWYEELAMACEAYLDSES